MMQNTIELLYNGAVYPAERMVPKNKAYREKCRDNGELKEVFSSNLSDAMKVDFEHMETRYCSIDLLIINLIPAFTKYKLNPATPFLVLLLGNQNNLHAQKYTAVLCVNHQKQSLIRSNAWFDTNHLLKTGMKKATFGWL